VIVAIERAIGVRPPALIVSADTGPDHREALRAAGLSLLTKPVSPARLRAALWMLAR
jgi:DNA-binding response OmpR family regulator